MMMKTFLILCAMSLSAIMTHAQTHQMYFRVEFDKPMTGNNNDCVSAKLKDNYTYCNPEHEYLDFQAGGNVLADGISANMAFRTTASVTDGSYFYIDNKRAMRFSAGESKKVDYPYLVDHITKMTPYEITVEKVSLVDSTSTHEITFVGDGRKYQASEFTFNRLPRNVAELKTLMEKDDGSRVEATNNPLFIAAVMYLVWPRLLDCSHDCYEMIEYLYGVQHSALQTYGIAPADFQDICIARFDGKDSGGAWQHNNLFQHFAGATPANQYKPNGKSYAEGPYKVRVAIESYAYLSSKQCTIAKVLLMPNPDATSKEDVSFDSPTAHKIEVRSTNKNGWFFYGGDKVYCMKGKAQVDTSF